MTDETRKDQDHKDEIADKDLEQASGGTKTVNRKVEEHRDNDRRDEDHRDVLRMGM